MGKYGDSSGMSTHRLHGTWYQMLRRCYWEDHIQFSDYGGRGIVVCDEWRVFANYLSYVESVLGLKPDASYSVDRIDNEGNYEPGNIQWAPRSQQNTNQRLRRHVVPEGVSGFKGVRLHKKTGLWQARKSVRGREVSLGYFKDPADAARAYDRFSIEVLGSRAVTNFPVSDYA